MSKSAFGVEHLAKASQDNSERASHYGRMAGDLGGVGAALGTVGLGEGVVGHLEHHRHDPMGFTERPYRKTPMTRIGRARILNPISRIHRDQAKLLVPIAGASLALSAAYRAKQKKLNGTWEGGKSADGRTQGSRLGDDALGAGAAGVGGASLYAGMKSAHVLNTHAVSHQRIAAAEQRMLAENKEQHYLKPWELKAAKRMRNVSSRIVAVKKPGALLSAGAAAAGGAALVELGRGAMQHRHPQPAPQSAFGVKSP